MKQLLKVFLTVIVLLLSYDSYAYQEIIENPTYGKLQDHNDPPISFELIQEYRSDPENGLEIFGAADLTTTSDGNLYYIDKQLVAMDPKGNLLWKTGQEGRGPGDLNRPRGLATGGLYLYFDNAQGTRIDQFSLKGDYVHTFNLDEKHPLTEVVGVTDSGYLVTSSVTWASFGKKVSVWIVSNSEKKLELYSEFIIDQSGNLKIPNGVSAGADIQAFGSKIYAGSVWGYSFSIYNLDGTMLKKITRDYNFICSARIQRQR